jgi:hypothetical protein
MKKAIIIMFYLLISNSIFSQQIKVTRDFGYWAVVNIQKKLSKDFEINLEQQLRLYTNATTIDDYILDFGSKYKMNKNFKLGANIRYIYNKKRWNETENNSRYNLDLNYKGNISTKLKLYYRLRYQKDITNVLSETQMTNVNFSSIRNRIKIGYKINKNNRLYFSGEIFRSMEIFKSPYFNKTRFYLGNVIKTKIGDFNCSFGYEQEINTDYPLSFFFLKTVYTLKL